MGVPEGFGSFRSESETVFASFSVVIVDEEGEAEGTALPEGDVGQGGGGEEDMVDQGVGVGALAGELESGVDAAGLIAFSDEAGVAAVVQIGDRGFAVEEGEDVVAVVSFIFPFLSGGGGGIPFHVEIDLNGVVLPGGGGVVREDEAVVMNPDGETEAVTVPPGAEGGGEIVVPAPFLRRVVIGAEVVAVQGDPGDVPAVC